MGFWGTEEISKDKKAKRNCTPINIERAERIIVPVAAGMPFIEEIIQCQTPNPDPNKSKKSPIGNSKEAGFISRR